MPEYLDLFQNGRNLDPERDFGHRSRDRIAAILNAKPVANAALGPDFFSSIQLPARAVSGALHETVSDLQVLVSTG